jgi:signal peptidase I
VNFENTLRELLSRGVGARFRVAGDSMHPTIRSGDHVHVVPLRPAEIAPGHVVLARHARGLTAHRIVRIDGAGIITRGDNSLASDPVVVLSALLGRVERVERDGAATAVAPAAPPRLHIFARRLARLVRRASRLSFPAVLRSRA